MSKYKNRDIVFDYARDCISGKRIANKYRIKACERFLEDCESGRYDFDPKDAEFVIRIIENTICHQQGEDKEGTPLRPVGLHALCWTHGLTSMSLTKAQYAETIFRMAKTKTWTS